MKNLNIGLIGVGDMAQVMYLPILSKIKSVKIFALCDMIYSKSQIIGKRYGAEHAFDRPEDLLSLEELDAIFITTNAKSHYELATKAIQLGKPIYISRPVTENHQQSLELQKLATEHNTTVMVGMNQRFNNEIMLVKGFLNQNEIGNINYIKVGWLQKKNRKNWQDKLNRFKRGVTSELGLPLVDAILWANNFEQIKSVNASKFHRLGQTQDDLCVATLRFHNGSIGFLECSWAIYSSETKFYFNAYGQDGSTQISPVELNKGDGDILKPLSQMNRRDNLSNFKQSYEREIKHFINAALGLAPVISSLKEACQAMKVLDAIHLSAEQGREVMLSDMS